MSQGDYCWATHGVVRALLTVMAERESGSGSGGGGDGGDGIRHGRMRLRQKAGNEQRRNGGDSPRSDMQKC